MNTLSILQRQSHWDKNVFYPFFAVDDLLFNDWLYQFKKETENEFAVNILSPSLDLYDQEETETAWHYLGQIKSDGTHYVPLLTCPDDLDLACNVVMTEQVVSGDKIYWKRFGWNMGFVKNQDSQQIAWFDDDIPELVFDKDNFIKIFAELNQITADEWEEQNKIKLNMPFPAKEDWELEVESWYE